MTEPLALTNADMDERIRELCTRAAIATPPGDGQAGADVSDGSNEPDGGLTPPWPSGALAGGGN